MAAESRATREAWAAGYVRQAREDLAAAIALEGQFPSVIAMLLQMTFEKLAKGALLYGKRVSVATTQRSHGAALSLMKILRRHPTLLEGFQGSHAGAWMPTISVVERLTSLHPQIAMSGPHLEYPWSLENGQVRTPAEHLAPILEGIWSSEQGYLHRVSRVFLFAQTLADNAERLFA